MDPRYPWTLVPPPPPLPFGASRLTTLSSDVTSLLENESQALTHRQWQPPSMPPAPPPLPFGATMDNTGHISLPRSYPLPPFATPLMRNANPHHDWRFEDLRESQSPQVPTVSMSPPVVPFTCETRHGSPFVVHHICRYCYRPRSKRYHREHPVPPDGVPPPPGVCHRCSIRDHVALEVVDRRVERGGVSKTRLGIKVLTTDEEDEEDYEGSERDCRYKYVIRTDSDAIARAAARRALGLMSRRRRRSSSRRRQYHLREESRSPSPPHKVVYRYIKVRDEERGSPDRTETSSRAQEAKLIAKARSISTSMQIQPTERAQPAPSSAGSGSRAAYMNVPLPPLAPLPPPEQQHSASRHPSTRTSLQTQATEKPPSVSKAVSTMPSRSLGKPEQPPPAIYFGPTESVIRRIAHEEVQRYRQAERKLDAHKDAFAHGQMVPLERKKAVEKARPEIKPCSRVSVVYEQKERNSEAERKIDTHKGDFAYGRKVSVEREKLPEKPSPELKPRPRISVVYEQKERYSEAERKFRAHPDPYSRGHMVPVEGEKPVEEGARKPAPGSRVSNESKKVPLSVHEVIEVIEEIEVPAQEPERRAEPALEANRQSSAYRDASPYGRSEYVERSVRREDTAKTNAATKATSSHPGSDVTRFPREQDDRTSGYIEPLSAQRKMATTSRLTYSKPRPRKEQADRTTAEERILDIRKPKDTRPQVKPVAMEPCREQREERRDSRPTYEYAYKEHTVEAIKPTGRSRIASPPADRPTSYRREPSRPPAQKVAHVRESTDETYESNHVHFASKVDVSSPPRSRASSTAGLSRLRSGRAYDGHDSSGETPNPQEENRGRRRQERMMYAQQDYLYKRQSGEDRRRALARALSESPARELNLSRSSSYETFTPLREQRRTDSTEVSVDDGKRDGRGSGTIRPDDSISQVQMRVKQV